MMKSGPEYTKRVKDMLKDAQSTNRNLYMPSTLPGGNPVRLIRVYTQRGLTIADTMSGGNIPITNLTIDQVYIQ